jgi:hypothetical protein
MFELLLYTTLSCSDARDIISGVNNNKDMPNHIKVELVETIRDSVQIREFCEWDATD